LNIGAAEIVQALAAWRSLERVAAVLDALGQLQPLAAYLAEAQSVLPDDDAWVARAETARGEVLDALRRLARGEGAFSLHAWRQRLEELKRDYVAAYDALHAQYVLGPGGDERRARLMRSPRRQQLRVLAGIDLFGQGDLNGWNEAVAAIPTCREYHQGLLADTPTCPHCRFRPLVAGSMSADARLQALENRLDTLLAQWHGGLHAALTSATAQASIHSMTDGERRPIKIYLQLEDPAAGTLPDKLVESVNRALRGLQTLAVHPDALIDALRHGGLPCTVDELEQRFRLYVHTLMRGHDEGNTRLTID
jgi:hypothetical protein